MLEPDTVKLEMPASPQYVSVPRKAVEGIASRLMLSEEQISDLMLAVGEACTNAVKFSGPGNPPVSVLYRIEPDRLTVEVRNSGMAVHADIKHPSKPPIEEYCQRGGGLGLYLIDQVMDEMRITSDSGETTLTMVKLLNR